MGVLIKSFPPFPRILCAEATDLCWSGMCSRLWCIITRSKEPCLPGSLAISHISFLKTLTPQEYLTVSLTKGSSPSRCKKPFFLNFSNDCPAPQPTSSILLLLFTFTHDTQSGSFGLVKTRLTGWAFKAAFNLVALILDKSLLWLYRFFILCE